MSKNFWMSVQKLDDFENLKKEDFKEIIIPKNSHKKANRMETNDRLIFYITELKKWAASATIDSHNFSKEENPQEDLVYKASISINCLLNEDDYIKGVILGPTLYFLRNWSPEKWDLAFTDPLYLLPRQDFKVIEGEMERIINK
ncbi:MAG: hypothetical protein CL760_12180 [Chloroflexi bacterium]|nr:hypothetical protein [Chloroflexota bacterium]|tara:strand:+ start:9501 stop:9932 length:432 start_codon:yes stop_codon:yes gene_type:complete